MATEKIEFDGYDGRLAARLDRPEAGETKAYALFAHCFTCSKDIFAARRIARALTELGIATLRFDFTGLGHSDGEWANTNFSSNVEDLRRAAAFMKDTLQGPSLMIGHSLGGAAVLAAAGSVESCKAVATIGAPYDPRHVAHFLEPVREKLETEGVAEVDLMGRPFTVKKQFLDDIEGQDQAERIKRLKRPLLIFHAPLDEIVGVDNAAGIFSTAKHPKSFVSLDGADHMLSKSADADYVAQVISAWVSRYL